MSNSIRSMFQRVLPRPAPAEIDAADLGTCFGLECSLAPPEPEPPTASETATARHRWSGGLGLFGHPAG